LIVLVMWMVAIVGTLAGVVLGVLTFALLRDPAKDTSLAAIYGYVGTFIGVPSFLLLFVQIFLALRARLRPENPIARLRREVRNDLEARIRIMRLGNDDVHLRYAPNGRGRGTTLDKAAKVQDFSSRVVFVGSAGAGKSYSALRVALSILRENDSLLPIVVPLSRWNDQGDWTSWLCDFIANELKLSLETVADQLEDGRLVPILDGLDEPDRPGDTTLADNILQQIVPWRVLDRPAPLILTCRGDMWRRLRATYTSHESLTVFAVKPVGIGEARAFASRVLIQGVGATNGDDLVDALHHAGRSDVVQSPWKLTMACAVAETGGLSCALQASADGTLVREFVNLTASRAANKGAKGIRMSLDLWWLAAYARYLNFNLATKAEIDGLPLATGDLELHRLWPAAGQRSPRFVDLGMATALSAPGLVWGVHYLWDRGLLVRAALVVCVLMWMGLMARTTLKPWAPPSTQDFSRLAQPRFVLRQTGFAATVAFVAGTVFGPLIALLVFLTAWFAIGLTVGFGQTLATDSEAHVVGPLGVLRRERRVSRSAAWTLAPLLSVAFAQSWGWRTGTVLAVVYCTAVGETVGCALWRRYLAMIIASRLRLTPTPGATLERLHRIGLVRAAGLAYQLRHEDLLKHFASRDEGPFSLLRG
jgi:hypothetical protein